MHRLETCYCFAMATVPQFFTCYLFARLFEYNIYLEVVLHILPSSFHHEMAYPPFSPNVYSF